MLAVTVYRHAVLIVGRVGRRGKQPGSIESESAVVTQKVTSFACFAGLGELPCAIIREQG